MGGMAEIELRGLSVALDGNVILEGIDLAVTNGEMVGVLGPNGSGKSTLLRTIWGSLKPVRGAVFLDGRPLADLGRKSAAQHLAAVTQEEGVPIGLTARDAVAMGRTPHKRAFATDDDSDVELIKAAMRRVGVSDLAERDLATLSGGERQRVRIARAFAQEPRILILDEPTNHLDIRYQVELLNLIRQTGLTVLAALHDLNLAAAYCDRLLLLSCGRVVAVGAPHEVLVPNLIEQVYGIAPSVITHPVSGAPRLIFGP